MMPVGRVSVVVNTTGQAVVKPCAVQVTTPGAAMVAVIVAVVELPGQTEEMLSPSITAAQLEPEVGIRTTLAPAVEMIRLAALPLIVSPVAGAIVSGKDWETAPARSMIWSCLLEAHRFGLCKWLQQRVGSRYERL